MSFGVDEGDCEKVGFFVGPPGNLHKDGGVMDYGDLIVDFTERAFGFKPRYPTAVFLYICLKTAEESKPGNFPNLRDPPSRRDIQPYFTNGRISLKQWGQWCYELHRSSDPQAWTKVKVKAGRFKRMAEEEQQKLEQMMRAAGR